MVVIAEVEAHRCAGCPGCASHPSRLPALEPVVQLALVPDPVAAPAPLAPTRTRRPRWKKVALISAGAVVGLVALAGAYIGITLYKIDHAVHHVSVPESLLAKGKGDLLAVVEGPDHHEEIYVFNTTAGHTKVLLVPSTLGVTTGHSTHTVPLSALNIHQPEAIIAGLRQLGIPVGHYVGVDLHAVAPDSSLGQLALGKISMASLIGHPAGTTSMLEAVASHVYLGPHTSVSSLLSLMKVPTRTPVSVPTSTTSNGQVVEAAPAVNVLRHFL
jgi:hypothetical protein